jgi:hypothetical protein
MTVHMAPPGGPYDGIPNNFPKESTALRSPAKKCRGDNYVMYWHVTNFAQSYSPLMPGAGWN